MRLHRHLRQHLRKAHHLLPIVCTIEVTLLSVGVQAQTRVRKPPTKAELHALIPRLLKAHKQYAFRLQGKKRNEQLNRIAGFQSTTNDIVGAKQTARDITSGFDKVDAYAEIAMAEARAGHVAEAKQDLQIAETSLPTVQEAFLKGLATSIIASAKASVGDIDGATKMIEGLDTQEQVSGFISLSMGYKILKNAKEAGVMLQKAKQAVQTIKEPEIKNNALRSLIEAFIEAGDLAGAEQSMEALEDPELKATTLLYLVITQIRNRDLTSAKTTVQKLKQRVADIAETASNREGRTRLLVQLSQVQAETGDVSGALQTAGSLIPPKTKVEAYSQIALAQIERGHSQDGKTTLQKAIQVTKSVTKVQDKCASYARIAAMQWKLGDDAAAKRSQQTAKQWAGRIPDPFERAFAIDAIREAQSEVGDFVGAVTTLETISDPDVRANSRILMAFMIRDAADARKK